MHENETLLTEASHALQVDASKSSRNEAENRRWQVSEQSRIRAADPCAAIVICCQYEAWAFHPASPQVGRRGFESRCPLLTHSTPVTHVVWGRPPVGAAGTRGLRQRVHTPRFGGHDKLATTSTRAQVALPFCNPSSTARAGPRRDSSAWPRRAHGVHDRAWNRTAPCADPSVSNNVTRCEAARSAFVRRLLTGRKKSFNEISPFFEKRTGPIFPLLLI